MAERVPGSRVADTGWTPYDASDPDNFVSWGERNFQGGIECKFHRTDLRKPLYKGTSDSLRKPSLTIWRTLLKFMGDRPDNRKDLSYTYQPNLGAVMNRLYDEVGTQPSIKDQNRKAVMQQEESNNRSSDTNNNQLSKGSSDTCLDPPTTLPRKKKNQIKKGGTLRRLKSTLSERLFTHNNSKSVFANLPLEETLQTPLQYLHYLVGYAILVPGLRDELYCQVSKQLIENPFKDSNTVGWMLLGMMAACFPPSAEVLRPLNKFLDKGPPMFANPVRKNMHRTLQNGCRTQPPSYFELQAGMTREMMEIEITLMDARTIVIPTDYATTAREVCLRLANDIGLKDQYGFSLFISMQDKVASLGNGVDHIFDAVSQCEQIYHERDGAYSQAPWKFYFRKEMFAPWPLSPRDPVGINLTYAQVVRGILLEEYPCNEDRQLAQLVAQQHYIDHGLNISRDTLRTVLPSYLPPDRLVEEDDMEQWLTGILEQHHELFGYPGPEEIYDENKEENDSSNKKSFNTRIRSSQLSENHSPPKPPLQVKMEIIQFAREKWALTFSRTYDVVKKQGPDWPDRLSIAISWAGLYIMAEGIKIHTLNFIEIIDVSFKDGYISFLVINGEVIELLCLDGADMKHLIDFMLAGLRKRSKYAIASEHCSDSGELTSVLKGDLLRLDSAYGLKQDASRMCHVINDRTQEKGELSDSRFYVLPTLKRPSEDIMNIFYAVSGRSYEPKSGFSNNDETHMPKIENHENEMIPLHPSTSGEYQELEEELSASTNEEGTVPLVSNGQHQDNNKQSLPSSNAEITGNVMPESPGSEVSV